MKTAIISVIIIILLALAALLYSVGHRLSVVRSGTLDSANNDARGSKTLTLPWQ